MSYATGLPLVMRKPTWYPAIVRSYTMYNEFVTSHFHRAKLGPRTKIVAALARDHDRTR